MSSRRCGDGRRQPSQFHSRHLAPYALAAVLLHSKDGRGPSFSPSQATRWGPVKRRCGSHSLTPIDIKDSRRYLERFPWCKGHRVLVLVADRRTPINRRRLTSSKLASGSLSRVYGTEGGMSSIIHFTYT